MMDIYWAIEELIKGKKVKTDAMHKNVYFFMNDGMLLHRGEYQSEETATYANLSDGFFSDTTWHLHEEHFNLSKKAIIDVSINGEEVPCVYPEKDIKEFITILKSAIQSEIDQGSCSVSNIMRRVDTRIDELSGERFK